MPQGQEFVKHELDEAIAIQQAIIDAEDKLSSAHPLSDAQQALKPMLETDRQQLEKLQELGQPLGAKGKAEDVAKSMVTLMKKTTEKAAEGDESEAYEAHAVLLTLKRKQQDSSAALLEIATKTGQKEMVTAARQMSRANTADAKVLTESLGQLAVQLATKE